MATDTLFETKGNLIIVHITDHKIVEKPANPDLIPQGMRYVEGYGCFLISIVGKG